MDKSETRFVRAASFVLAVVISAVLFGLFTSWAWTVLDPAQQETIAAINSRWFDGPGDVTLARGDLPRVSNETTAKGGLHTNAVGRAR